MGISTGSSILDGALDGGLPEGRSTLVIGGPGTGKTTLGMQFLQAGLDRREDCLYISTEQTVPELRDTFADFAFDIDHRQLQITTVHATPGYTVESEEPLLTLETFGDERLVGEQFGIPFDAQYVREHLADCGPVDRVVLDSVSGLSLLNEDYDAFRRTVLDLVRLFSDEFDATSIFVAEETMAATAQSRRSTADTDAIQFTTHGVLRLWRERVAGDLHRFLEVVKMRGVDHDTRRYEVEFDTAGLRVSPRLRSHPGDFSPDDHLSTGIEGLDALLGGGIVRGGSMLLEYDGMANPHSLFLQLLQRAHEQGMAVLLVPPVELPPKRFETVIADRIGSMTELMESDRLFLLDYPNVWENTRRNVFKPTEHTDEGTNHVFELIDERRGETPLFSMLNVEAQLPVMEEAELRKVRFWQEQNLYRPEDTSLYFFNPETMSNELAAFYRNGAWQVLRTWLDESGLQYVKLRKSPSGFLGSTRLVEYVDEEPFVRIQHRTHGDGEQY